MFIQSRYFCCLVDAVEICYVYGDGRMKNENANSQFTGERFIPGIEDDKLKMEHYQRYLSVRNLVRGKVVLDAACGEGYGSNIIASVAQSVTGLDIDGDTIERAKINYGQQDNLHFLQGSIEKIPLEDASVDVAVSFETIGRQRCVVW